MERSLPNRYGPRRKSWQSECDVCQSYSASYDLGIGSCYYIGLPFGDAGAIRGKSV